MICFFYRTVLLVQEPHANEIIQCIFLCAELILFSIVFPRFICVILLPAALFFILTSSIPLYEYTIIPLVVHLLTDGVAISLF